ncbi:crotonase/enoyl-CoA hydratase family protein [Amycolatopsis ultiminotia]|uniref:Crotonase/enoyl-CoA hydratase family protein n=1 Tax=Amycolatopsis ultiminotia TaxID=543629 RepID=A0ABP6UY68_9PSEU
MTEELEVVRHDAVLVVTLNRPRRRNAMNGTMARALAAAMDELDADPSLVVGVLTGAGGAFCAGMDLAAFLAGDVPDVPGRGLGGITRTPPQTPLIAAVEGYALAGGLELALACDLIVAAEDATFGLPETTRGLIAGAGGLVRLPRRIPPGVALQYALTGESFGAAEAAGWGLVNAVTPSGSALDKALKLAERIAANGPLAVRVTKEVVTQAPDWPADTLWDRQQELLDHVLASDDAREGAAAFAEKRSPHWTGR